MAETNHDSASLFNQSSQSFNPDALATDSQIAEHLQIEKTSIASARSRGSWPIRSVKIGKLRRTRVGDVIEYLGSQLKSA